MKPVAELVSCVPHPAHAKYYAEIVHEKSINPVGLVDTGQFRPRRWVASFRGSACKSLLRRGR